MAEGEDNPRFEEHYWRSAPEASDTPAALSITELNDGVFRMLADNIPTLCWIANGDGYIVWYNRRWHEYCGTTPGQMEGWGWQSVHDPDVLPSVVANWQHAITQGHPFEMTFPLRGADGQFRPFLTRIQPIRSENGQVIRWFGVNTDISKQVEAEAALHESLLKFRSVAEAVPGFVWTAGEEGRLDYTSPHWYDYSGAAPDASNGEGWMAFVHPDDQADTFARWAKSVETRAPYEAEFRLRRAGGAYRWWLARARAIHDAPQGTWRWIGVCTDLQEIVEARNVLTAGRAALEQTVSERTHALRLTEARLRTLSDSSLQLLGLLDLDGRVLDCNQASLEAIGAARDEIVGRVYWETPWFSGTPGMPDRVRAAAAKAAGGEIARSEITLSLPSGSVRTYDFALRPVRDDQGEIVAVAPDATDITERQSLEDQLRQSQKMEAVGQLTGGIAHDFNNLLTGIMGSLDLLQKRIAQGRISEVDHYVNAAQGAARRAAALTHRLLAFSRRQTLSPKPVDINRLALDMEELIRRTAGPTIKTQFVGASGLWTAIVDPNQLENALLNLCINARDAMPDGGRLTIETGNRRFGESEARARDLPPGEYLALSVTDNGTGMSPDVAERAFDPFFTTKPIGQGTGLGLSMIYGFARQSGGQVRIESTPGAGTRMSIYLPRHAGGSGGDAEGPALSGAALAAPLGECVLVVDDEPSVRMLVADALAELGYAAIEAMDGPSGLEILRSAARIDLLITDVGLPGGLNGRQLADAGRVLRPGLKVLFMTGYAEHAVFANGPLDGGMQILTKPFPMDTLSRRIQALIAR